VSENKGLHISREITWGHIMTTLGVLIAGVLAYSDFTSTVAVMNTQLTNLERQDTKHEKKHDSRKKDIEKKLDKMDSSLEQIKDHLIRGHTIPGTRP